MTYNLSECSSNISFGKSLCCVRKEGTAVLSQGSLLEGRAKELGLTTKTVCASYNITHLHVLI